MIKINNAENDYEKKKIKNIAVNVRHVLEEQVLTFQDPDNIWTWGIYRVRWGHPFDWSRVYALMGWPAR